MAEITNTPEQIERAAKLFEHIAQARAAGKVWWADGLHAILEDQIAFSKSLRRLVEFYGRRDIANDDALLPADDQEPEIAEAMRLVEKTGMRF